MDALSGVLESAKLKTVVYPKFSFTAPWGIEMDQDSRSQFWRLLKGTCYLRVPGEKAIKMNVGDVVCIPHGSKHSFQANLILLVCRLRNSAKLITVGSLYFKAKMKRLY